MQEEIDLYFEEARESMQSALERLGRELTKIRTGKASASIFSGVMADYYGTQTPITQMANISATDARTLVIQPWDKGALQPIETAIINSNMGLNPQNDGEIIRINIPALTEDRRREMVKKVKALAEDAKVSIRSARKDLMDGIKSAVKDGYPEDSGKRMESNAEEVTKEFGAKADKAADAREKEIMTV